MAPEVVNFEDISTGSGSSWNLCLFFICIFNFVFQTCGRWEFYRTSSSLDTRPSLPAGRKTPPTKRSPTSPCKIVLISSNKCHLVLIILSSPRAKPNLVQNLHFWSFWAKYCHFLHILSNARPKTNVNKVPRWVFRYVGNKTFDFSSKKKDFLPKNDQIWPKTGIFGQFGPGLFSALLMGRLVVVARRLYLARHLFTLLLW